MCKGERKNTKILLQNETKIASKAASLTFNLQENGLPRLRFDGLVKSVNEARQNLSPSQITQMKKEAEIPLEKCGDSLKIFLR